MKNPETAPMLVLSDPLTKWQWLNAIMAGALLVMWIAVILSALFIAGREPFDYRLLMDSAQRYCYAPDTFAYGVTSYADAPSQLSFYPATFYVAFCVPYQFAPVPTLLIWMLMPLVVALILSGGRAAVLAYAPLFLMTLLGQSTGWVMLMLALVAHYERGGQVRAWHGVAIAPLLFKPHLAALGALALAWRWRRSPATVGVALATSMALIIPSFMLSPTWLLDWLSEGRRGFEIGSMVSVAGLWVRVFHIPFAPPIGVQVLVWVASVGVALVLLVALRWRRGRLEFYDYLLVLCLSLPAIHDYDLIVLLPFIALRPRLLLMTLATCILAWLYAMFTRVPDGFGIYTVSALITWVLYMARLFRRDDSALMRDVPARLGHPLGEARRASDSVSLLG